MNSPYSSPSWRLLIFISLLLISACTLTGAPEPTIDSTSLATITVPPTRTPQDTSQIPTSRPTFTPRPLATQPSSPPTVILPPTSVPQQNTPLPISIVILSPVPGNVVAGNVQVLGAATHPQFLQYQVEYGPDPNPGNLWFPATGVIQTPVINGLLGIWSTTSVDDGRYQIRLRVTLRDGTTLSTVVNNIRVQNQQPTPVPTATSVPRPIAAFTQSTTSGQAPLVVNFVNQSQGQVTGYQWNFGDGGSSTEINPTYTYRQPGIYTVQLTAIGPGGDSNVSRQISVQSQTAPVAAFTQNTVSGQSPLTVQFTDQSTGNITSREWRFGDGATTTGQNPTHTFTDVGTYNVLLTVAGPGGSSTARRQITVENPAVPPPDADFTASETQGEAPMNIQFSVVSNANITTYDWRIDGETFSNNPNPQYTFTEAGTYTIELIAVGAGGQDTARQTITVTQPPDVPNITIAANPESGDVPLTVQFSVQSTGGEITTYVWDFGDGNTSNQAVPSHTYQQQGTYNVLLTVEGPGGSDQDTVAVTAVEPMQPPTADFQAVIADADDRLTVNFNNLSSGENLSYTWDFGDGNTSAESSPQYTYAAYGTYEVSLTVANAAGEDTAAQQITLEQPAQAVNAVASAAPLQAALGETIQFDSSGSTGDIATYDWDFGDGNASDQANPTHTYQQPGTFTTTLTLTGVDNSTSTDTVEVTITTPLQAAFTANPNPVEAGQPVTFDAAASSGNIVSYAWDFGDSNISDQPAPTHTYQQPGDYPVRLVISDGVTQSEVINTVTVTAPAQPLQAAFTANPNPVEAGQPVTFDAAASSGNIVSYAWDFGDSNISDQPAPTHTYQQPGDYPVRLVISDGVTQSEVTITVTVTPQAQPLQAAFTANPNPVEAGQPVTFDAAASSGNIVEYNWFFGDGAFGSGMTTTYTYQQPGDYPVRLVISDGVTQSEVTITVTVTPQAQPLQAAFTANPNPVEAGQPVTFDASASTGDISTFSWDFGDSTTSNDPLPTHTYQQPGQYTVRLTVNSIGGEMSEISQTMIVTPPAAPPANPVIAFASDRAGNRQIFVMDAAGTNVQRITDSGGTAEQPVWSANNEIAFVLNGEIFIMGTDGSGVRPLSPDGGVTVIEGDSPTWSPDGQRIAYAADPNGNGITDIFVIDVTGANQTQLTADQGSNQQPRWSPDGSRIAFVSDRDGQLDIYTMSIDGSNQTRLTDNPGADVHPSWSPDGSRLLFTSDREEAGNDRELYMMGADGSNPTRITNSPGVDAQPVWSSNGSQIVFMSARDGDQELYVMGADGSNPTRITNSPGVDTQPTYKPSAAP